MKSTEPPPPQEERRTDGKCVAKLKGLCVEASHCPWLKESCLIAECEVCGYDDTDCGPTW